MEQAGVRLGAERKPRSRRWMAKVAGGCGLVVLFVLPALYWRAVNYVQPFELPERPLPSPNGYDVAVRAVRQTPAGVLNIINSDPPMLGTLTPADWERLEAKQRPNLLAVRRAFSLKWQVPRPEENLAPDLLAWSFALESRLAAARGDSDAALEWSLDAVELGGNLCRGGAGLHRYTGQFCQNLGLQQAERILPRLSGDGLLRSAVRVRRIRESWPTIGETLENQRLLSRASSTEYLRLLSKKSFWVQLDLTGTRGKETAIHFQLPLTSRHIFIHRWVTWQRVLTPHAMVAVELDRYYRELIDASSRPAPHGVQVKPVTNIWAETYADSSFTGRYRGEWPRHNLALLEAALIVAHYRRVHGKAPKSLEEIPADWWPQVPVDVWGQPVRCRLKGDRAIVYSIGPDGVDEGGRAVDPSSVVSGGTGDLVFGKLCDADWPRRAGVR